MTDDRLAALEARLATLEAHVGLAGVPARDWMPNPAIRPPAPSATPALKAASAGHPRSLADLEEPSKGGTAAGDA